MRATNYTLHLVLCNLAFAWRDGPYAVCITVTPNYSPGRVRLVVLIILLFRSLGVSSTNSPHWRAATGTGLLS